MKLTSGKLLLSSFVVFALSGLVLTPVAEAARRGGGGAHHAGGGGGANRPHPQANNNRADVRTNNVRSTSVNNVNRITNVNVNRNTNVNVDVDHHGGCCGWDNDYHPIATAAAVTAT